MFFQPGDSNIPVRPPFKSVAVPRPIAWISTLSEDGIPNLAPYSQFTNLSFDPPYILIAVNEFGKRKDTANNIERTGEFVHNLVTYELAEKMNITCGAFPPNVDEFEMAGLTKEPAKIVKCPMVAESPVKLECKYIQTIRLPGKGKTAVDAIIGEVVGYHIAEEFVTADGKIDMERIRPLARMGYSDYTWVEHVFSMPAYDAGTNAFVGLEGAAKV